MIRFVRLTKLIRILKNKNKKSSAALVKIESGKSRIYNFLFAEVLMLHILACMWLWIA